MFDCIHPTFPPRDPPNRGLEKEHPTGRTFGGVSHGSEQSSSGRNAGTGGFLCLQHCFLEAHNGFYDLNLITHFLDVLRKRISTIIHGKNRQNASWNVSRDSQSKVTPPVTENSNISMVTIENMLSSCWMKRNFSVAVLRRL